MYWACVEMYMIYMNVPKDKQSIAKIVDKPSTPVKRCNMLKPDLELEGHQFWETCEIKEQMKEVYLSAKIYNIPVVFTE